MKLKVAAKLILVHEGKVLIVADPRGKWDFPGGGIENDEKLDAALRREIMEETGIDQYQVDRLVHVDEWFIEKHDLHVVGVFYQGSVEGKLPDLVLSHEHSTTAWVSPREVKNYDVTPDTLHALEAAGL